MNDGFVAAHSCIDTLHYLIEKHWRLFTSPVYSKPSKTHDFQYPARLTEEKRQKIIALRLQGVHMRVISAEVGCSHSTVSKVCSGKKYPKKKAT